MISRNCLLCGWVVSFIGQFWGGGGGEESKEGNCLNISKL